MTRTIAVSLSSLLIVVGLAACGESPQEVAEKKVPGTTVKHDTRPWEGDALAHQSGTFTRGDKASWDKALETRMQGQNEYLRTGGGAR